MLLFAAPVALFLLLPGRGQDAPRDTPAPAVSPSTPVQAEEGRAPGRRRRQRRAQYDPSTVITVTGQVGAVVDVPTGYRTMREMVMVAGDQESRRVRLGPLRVVKTHPLELRAGQTVEVKGSLVREGDEEILLAAEVEVDGARHVLRDGKGHYRMGPKFQQRGVPAASPPSANRAGSGS